MTESNHAIARAGEGSPPNVHLADELSNLSNAAHLKQKRARSQLSCTPCRTGKLKCNRDKPACDQCIKRSRESLCLYLPPPPKHRQVQNVKGRIRQLETLVVDLMNQNNNGPRKTQRGEHRVRETTESSDDSRPSDHFTPPSGDDDLNPEISRSSQHKGTNGSSSIDAATPLFGQMDISKDEIRYHGEAHWNAILHSISELKRDLSDDEDEDGEKAGDAPESLTWGSIPLGNAPRKATSGLGFMMGASQPVTKEQLIAAVPEKKVADRLLSLWFNSPDPFKGIVHAPTFQDEYKRFIRNPSETPVMWLGLLFAILSLAASFGLRDSDPNGPQAQRAMTAVNRYHTLAASAAVLGDFTKPKEYTLECLMLYTAGLQSNDAFVNIWLMIGLVCRLALRMGYHRDPKHYPNISAFHGEMRRRLWAIITMMDVLISFQLGLPSMVKMIQCDVEPPGNLLDRDFNVDSKMLPPNRAIEELTPCSYVRIKLRIVRCFSDAAELSHATIAPSYEVIMKLDKKLEEAKAAIPPLLQMPEIGDVITDPAEQIMCRFNLDLLYLKTKTLLHRRYMVIPLSQLSAEEQERGIGKSRETCIVCALRVLQHHHTIYQACQPGGQLESVKWYMGALSTHDFLLAAMIICLELSSQVNDLNFQTAPFGLQCPRRRAMMDALEKSQKIWSDTSKRERSAYQMSGQHMAPGTQVIKETEKACKAMAVMLEKVRDQFPAQARTPTPERQMKLMSTDLSKRSDQRFTLDFAGRCPEDPRNQQSVSTGASTAETDGWSDVNNVPMPSVEELPNIAPAGTALFDNSPAYQNQTGFQDMSSNEVFPDLQYAQQMDFSMIGDMLGDIHNADFDWQMLDSQFNQEGEFHESPYSLPSSGKSPATNTGFGTTMAAPAGFATGAGAVAFPAFTPQGANGQGVRTGLNEPYASSNDQVPAFMSGYTDDGSNVGLEDISFDLGVLDANRYGMYPATKDDWAHFRQRQSGTTG